MNKTVNDFKNLFSVIFFMIGAYFLIIGIIHIGIIALISLALILFVNSDWFYSNFDVKHYNFFVTFMIFFLIGINSFFIYDEMKYSALFNNVTQTDKTNYINYETALVNAIKPCISNHNQLVVLMNTKKEIPENSVKTSNLICYRSIENIEKQEPADTLPKEVKNLCIDLRNNLSQIAVNLSAFEYAYNTPQKSLQDRVYTYYKNTVTDTKKIREIMNINETENEITKNIVQF